MKYIRTIDTNDKHEIFVFPRTVHHDAYMESIDRIKNQCHGNWQRVHRKAVSAGFVDSSLRCFGGSETLKLESLPEDSSLLKTQLGG